MKSKLRTQGVYVLCQSACYFKFGEQSVLDKKFMLKSLSEGRSFCQSDLFIKSVAIIFSKVFFRAER